LFSLILEAVHGDGSRHSLIGRCFQWGASLEQSVQKCHDSEYHLDALQKVWFPKVRDQVEYCFNNSEYYEKALRAAGLESPRDIRSLDDFRNLPPLMNKASHLESQRESLKRFNHPFGMHLCAPIGDVRHVAATSGTTGNPTFYTFTQSDLIKTYEMFGRLFRQAGIRKGETVFHAYGLSLWLAGTTILQALEHYGARPIPVGAEAGTSKILRYLELTRPRVLMATPSLVTHLIERSESEIGRTVGSLGIETIICAGEPGAGLPAVRRRIMEAYGARIFDFSGGAWFNMAMSCEAEQSHSGLHYLADDHCFRYDLIDPTTKKPLPLKNGQVGEALCTGLGYQAGPALRYASGDVLKLTVDECPYCGEFGSRFNFVGRVDDLLNVKGVKVYPSAIKEVVEQFQPDVSGQMKIVLSSAPPRVPPPMMVTVEAGANSSGDFEQLSKRIEERIRELLAVRTKITIVEFGSIPRSHLKTKLVEVRSEEAS